MEFTVKEKVVLALCDDVQAEGFPEETQRLVGLPAAETARIIQELLAEGYLSTLDLGDDGTEELWYYRTNKATKDLLDADASSLYDVDGLRQEVLDMVRKKLQG
jgi:hypothetical protein